MVRIYTTRALYIEVSQLDKISIICVNGTFSVTVIFEDKTCFNLHIENWIQPLIL